MILQKDKNLVQIQQQYGTSFCEKKLFQIWIFLADIALLMSDFSDFDEDQISLRLLAPAHRLDFSDYLESEHSTIDRCDMPALYFPRHIRCPISGASAGNSCQ